MHKGDLRQLLKRLTNFVGDSVEAAIHCGLPRNKSCEEWCRCFVTVMLNMEGSCLNSTDKIQTRDSEVREFVEKVGQHVLSERGRESCQFGASATN